MGVHRQLIVLGLSGAFADNRNLADVIAEF